MFEMFSKVEIEILTLEVDVRFEDASDLFVEVYVVEGGFISIVNDESAWELVAQTTMVLAPEGSGAIIPVQDFTPVLMPKRTKRSFYITMRERAIDFTAYALQKTGEVAVDSEDFNILVGSGLAEYKFPEKIDRVLDPQFSGVVHYRAVAESCDAKPLTSTLIEYKFLFGVDADASFIKSVNAIVYSIVEKQLEENAALIQYRQAHRLSIGDAARSESVSFSGNCPPDWSVCPKSYELITVAFSHSDSLPGGLVKLEFLNSFEFAAATLQSSLPNSIPSIYLGEKSVSFQYNMTLDDVSSEAEMDDIQKDYFATVAASFVDSFASDRFSSALAVVIETQQNSAKRRRTQGQATNVVGGVIHGSVPAAFESSHFKETLELAFRNSNNFIDMLRINGLRPSQVTSGNRISYFMGISQISATFEEIVRAIDPVVAQDDSLSNSAIAMIEGAAFIIFLIGITWGIHSYRKGQRRKREAEENRKRRRDDLRNERERKRASDEATVSLLSASERPGKSPGPSVKNQPKDFASSERSASNINGEISKTASEAPIARPLSPASLSSNRHSKAANTNTKPGLVKSHSVARLGRQNSIQSNGSNSSISQPAKRPNVTRSLSVSAIKAVTSADKQVLNAGEDRENKVGLISKIPSIAMANGTGSLSKQPITAQKSRPNFARSQSSSALMSKSTDVLGGRPSVTTVAKNVLETTTNTNSVPAKGPNPVPAGKARPTISRSLSVSVLSSGPQTTKNVESNSVNATVRSNNAPLPHNKPRPILTKSLSVSVLATTTTPKTTNVIARSKATTVVKTEKNLPGPSKARPSFARSQSSSVLVKNRPVMTQQQNSNSSVSQHMAASNVEAIKGNVAHPPSGMQNALRPAMARSLSTSLLQTGGNARINPPRKSATGPVMRPTFVRSHSNSVLVSDQTAPSDAEEKSQTAEESTTSKAGHLSHFQLVKPPQSNSEHAKVPGPIRPSLVRSQSSSVLGVNAAKIDPICPARSKVSTAASDSSPPSPGESVEIKLKTVRPQFLRSQSSSLLQARSSSIHKFSSSIVSKSNEMQTIGVAPKGGLHVTSAAKITDKQAPTKSDIPVATTGAMKTPPGTRPALARSMSSSVLQQKSGLISKAPSKPQASVATKTNGPATVAAKLPNQATEKVTPASRPAFARSMSSSVLQQTGGLISKAPSKPQAIVATKTNGPATVDAKLPNQATEKVTPASRPAFARSMSSSVLLQKGGLVSSKASSKPQASVATKTNGPATVDAKLPNQATEKVTPASRPAFARSMSSSVLQQTGDLISKASSKPQAIVATKTNGPATVAAKLPNQATEKGTPASRPAFARSMSSSVLQQTGGLIPRTLSNQQSNAVRKVALNSAQPTKHTVQATATAKPGPAARRTFSRSMSSSLLQPNMTSKAFPNQPSTSIPNVVPEHATKITHSMPKPIASTSISVRPRAALQRSMSSSLLQVNRG